MTRPLIPFVQNGYYASRNWIPLVKGNGFTTSGGGEQEEVWETASGSIATFTAVPAPLRQLSVAVEPVQSGTGDPSPTNVRPITGWDSVTVNRTGKNLLKITMQSSTGQQGVDTTINDDGTVTINGTTTAVARRALGNVSLKKGVTYYLSGAPNLGSPYVTYLYRSGVGTLARETGAGASYTATEDMTVSFYISVNGGTTVNNAVFRPMLSTSSDTAFAAYSGNTYTIQLGETVYGGTLDVVNGKMTVDRAAVTISELSWTYNSTFGRIQTNEVRSVIEKPAGNDKRLDGLMCSAYTTRSAINTGTQAINGTIAVATTGYIYIRDEAYSDADAWKTAMGSQTIIYPLATPFELTLTPEQISTLQGTNNVWSDAGDVTVEYRAQ